MSPQGRSGGSSSGIRRRGCLFAEGSREQCGEKLARSRIILNHAAAIDTLKEFAERVLQLPVLRIYWYDGTSQGPSSQHLTLAGLDYTKVRRGLVNSRGQRKGVDSLIVAVGGLRNLVRFSITIG